MIGPIEFHARLVEEAVWAAFPGRDESVDFHRDRERLYSVTDPAERESAFASLHWAWFERLGLAVPVAAALKERETVLAPARRILFGPSLNERPEGAELYVARPGEFTVVVNLRPRTLVDGTLCLSFLRRELLHVCDMLDPDFAYEPRLPPGDIGPAQERRLQDRYRALWNCSVDGRLVRLGHLDSAVRAERSDEFRRAFASLSDSAGACFDRIFSGARPTHPQLVRIAADPEAGFGLEQPRSSPAGRCPLCGFPAAEFEPGPAGLPSDVLRAIASEFAAWRPEQGLCPQCADLYRLRPEVAEAGR